MMKVENFNKFVLTAMVWATAGVAGGQTPTQFEDQHLLASDGAGSDFMGIAVSISDAAGSKIAVAGAWKDDTIGGTQAGSAYIYRLSGTTWVEEAHLFASDGSATDWFGRAVAASSEVVLVGAYFDDTAAGLEAGSVYAYRFNGTTWVEEGHLFASDGAPGDLFGNSVSVSGLPGSEVAIVGANLDGPSTGSAYVFRFNGTTWVEEAHLFASDGAALDQHGRSVSISGAPGSEVAIVGASLDDNGGGVDAGSVYVYRYNGKTWVEEAHLLASDGAAGDFFGVSVSISGDPGSEVVIVGSQRDDTGAGFRAGSAYVFRFNGTTWVEEGHLFASDGSANDELGFAVSISGLPGSEVAIVGSIFDDTPGGTNTGSAYVYRFDGATWGEIAHLLSSDGAANDSFGASVSISGSAGSEVAIVGSIFDDTAGGIDAGSAYIFDIPGPPSICTGDITPVGGNGVVNIDDLVAVLNGFGVCPTPPASCDADITPPGGNGVVNIDDLVGVLNAFGACP